MTGGSKLRGLSKTEMVHPKNVVFAATVVRFAARQEKPKTIRKILADRMAKAIEARWSIDKSLPLYFLDIDEAAGYDEGDRLCQNLFQHQILNPLSRVCKIIAEDEGVDSEDSKEGVDLQSSVRQSLQTIEAILQKEPQDWYDWRSWLI